MREGLCLVRMDDGTIAYANPKFEEMFGYGPGELLGLPVAVLVYDDGTGFAERRSREILDEVNRSGAADFEIENVRRDGRRFWCHVRTSVMTHATSAGSRSPSRTTSRSARRARRRSERVNAASSCSPTPCPRWSGRPVPTAGLDYFNQRWFDYTGLTFEQSEGSGWAATIHPADVPAGVDAWTRSLGTGEAVTRSKAA